MTDLSAREYEALRATVRSRGTIRPSLFLTGLAAWAAVLVAILIWLPTPLAAVVPLLILLATFETLRAFHLGVERIGRYIQVFFEENRPPGPLTPPAWEITAMAFGPTLPGAGVHPLFLPVFLLATPINFLAVVFPGPVPVELATLAVPHAAFIVWVVYCDRGVRRQRQVELNRYREMKAAGARSGNDAAPHREQH